MNKVVFFHDGPRWKDEQGNQYGTQADIDMYHRYQYLGNDVKFVMRVFDKPENVNLLNLNQQGLFILSVKPFNRPKYLKNYFESKKIIHKMVEDASIIVVRLPSTVGSIALRYAKEIKIPYLVEIVGCPWDSLRNHSLLGKIYAIMAKRKLKRLAFDSPYVVYVTRHFLQDRYPTQYNSTNISNVILKELQLENLKKSYYKDLLVDGKQLILSTLGVVDIKYKGQAYVIEAIAKLKQDGIILKYNIIGGGNHSRLLNLAIKLGVENQITFMGKLPHKEVFSVLDRTDIYIQPSETEGLPRALVEAMSRGCACISSDAGGMPELLDERVVFQSKNTNSLILKIRQLLNNEELSKQSERNFIEARKYEFSYLEAKRRNFYDEFLKSF
jgi:glycosyltransferase involved in cell wall biosynthesis